MRRGLGSSIGIGKITVEKRELLATLQVNQASHHANFLQACKVFQQRAAQELERLVDEIKAGKLPHSLAVPLPIPQEHLEDYQQAIRMLEWHQGSTIELDETAFAQLVEDNWGWHSEFEHSTMSYLATIE